MTTNSGAAPTHPIDTGGTPLPADGLPVGTPAAVAAPAVAEPVVAAPKVEEDVLGQDPKTETPKQEEKPAATSLMSDDPAEAKPAEKTDATDPETKTDAPGDAKAEVKAEDYQFVVPDGATLSPELTEAFVPLAMELGIKPEGAQKIVDLLTSKVLPKVAEDVSLEIAARNIEKHQQTLLAWANEARTDPDFGGDKFDENRGYANKAFKMFGAPNLGVIINEWGLGNHPAILKTFAAVGRAMSEDKTIIRGGAAAQQTPMRTADEMYAKPN